MTRPQIREENRKNGRGNTRGMRILRILRLMADGQPMTCPRAQLVLGGSIQTARNIVCDLVTQKLADKVTPKGRNHSATYCINDAGRLRLQAYLASGGDDELNADEEAERALAKSKVERNLAHARTSVPNSVFALGMVRTAVRAAGAAA